MAQIMEVKSGDAVALERGLPRLGDINCLALNRTGKVQRVRLGHRIRPRFHAGVGMSGETARVQDVCEVGLAML